MIRWLAPGEDGVTPVEHAITDDEAIRRMKEAAALKHCSYPNDHEALVDFMVIHWAWRTDK